MIALSSCKQRGDDRLSSEHGGAIATQVLILGLQLCTGATAVRSGRLAGACAAKAHIGLCPVIQIEPVSSSSSGSCTILHSCICGQLECSCLVNRMA